MDQIICIKKINFLNITFSFYHKPKMMIIISYDFILIINIYNLYNFFTFTVHYYLLLVVILGIIIKKIILWLGLVVDYVCNFIRRKFFFLHLVPC